MKDIREKHVVLSGLRVSISNPPESNRALCGPGTGELDDLIRGQTLGRKYWPPLEHTVLDTSFEAGNKEHLLAGEFGKPGEIHKGPVHHDNGKRGKFQELGHSEVGNPGGGDLDKGRNVAVVIQKRVELDTALGSAKLGPRKQRQAQIDHGGIQGKELVLEAELFPRSTGSALGVLVGKERPKERCWSLVVGIRKGCPLHHLHPQMVELCPMKLKMLNDIAQAASAGDLSEHHHHKLAPAVQSPILPLWLEPVALDFAKIMSVQKLQQLSEYYVRMCHGLNLLSFKWVTGNLTISRKVRFGPTSFS